ncbi:MAG: hypothetical protein CM15mP71_4610 [Candidatus Poseidoniales archaeon]|nr:MAG: hypothetical protein CM15mP71_4610 [Candidatus Poseidoniales archaeon]
MAKYETLRMAAIAAVLAASLASDDPTQSGRYLGMAQDHRRMNMGMSSLMHQRSHAPLGGRKWVILVK